MNIGGFRAITFLALSWAMLSGFCWSLDKSGEKVQEAIAKGEVATATKALEQFKEDCEESPRQEGYDESNAKDLFRSRYRFFKMQISALEEQGAKQAMRVQVDRMVGELGGDPLVCAWKRWGKQEGSCAGRDYYESLCAADKASGAKEQILTVYSVCGEKVKTVEDLVRIKNDCKEGEIQLLNKETGDIVAKKHPGGYCFPFPGFERLDKERQLEDFCSNLEKPLKSAIEEKRFDDAQGTLSLTVEANKNFLEWAKEGEPLTDAGKKALEGLAPTVRTIVELKWKRELARFDKIPASKTPTDLEQEVEDTESAVGTEREKLFLSFLAPEVDKWLQTAWESTKSRIEKEKTGRIKTFLGGNISKCAKLASRQHELVTHAKRCKQYGCPPAEWGKITTQLEPIDEELATLTDEFRRWIDDDVPELKALKQKAYSAGCLF